MLEDPTHTEWTALDYRLIKAYEMYQSYLDGAYPIWIDRSERVAWDVKAIRSGSKAAIERKTSGKNFKGAPGVSYYAVPKSMDGGPLPTKREYLEAQAALNRKPQ